MVPKKRFSRGFDFKNIPKGPRSSRRKKVSSKSNQISAIDMLASIAGKLLEESESSSTSSYAIQEKNHQHEDGYNENTSETCLQLSSLENENCIVEQTSISDHKKAHGLMLLAGCETKNDNGDEACVVNGLEDPSQLHVQFPESVHLNGIVKLSPGTYRIHNGAFEEYENHSNLVCRDDEENNYCKFYKFGDRFKSFRPLTRVGNRRIQKSVIEKYERRVLKLKCFEDTRTDDCLKRNSCYGYNQSKHETIHMKRRFSDKGLIVNSDGGLSSESVSNSPEKGGLVKLSIKSLKIPELFVEVPETATVGSLKRTVTEAVTALLGDGLSIGVLVQGKKVRDDDNTLSEIGLLCNENIDNLGFTLELGPKTLHEPLCSEDPVVSMQTDSTYLSERSAASPLLESCPLQDSDHMINSEISHALVTYQRDISANEQQPSPKRTEVSQRRTRRPFSVIEVEALVQAVEELGTGRWRDVKLRCFENATHRTYVDLKDKWKTLVHTATISPQQRRGEPMPQELLDRVLEAHRYWLQQRMKQKMKHEVDATMVVRSCKGGER